MLAIEIFNRPGKSWADIDLGKWLYRKKSLEKIWNLNEVLINNGEGHVGIN